MASGIIRTAVSNALDRTPARSTRSSQLHQWRSDLLEKSTAGEHEQTAFDQFSEQLVQFVRDRICSVSEGLTLNHAKRYKIWSDFHQLRQDNSGPLHSAWISFLQNINVEEPEDPLLEQSVYSELYSMLITEYFTSQASHQTGTSVGQIQITTHELNAMCYACGYVPRTLLKRYENKTGPVFSQYVQCLSDMAVEGEDDFDLYTKKWFDLVNRGGLFPLNEKTLMFFAAVEKCVRALLPKHVIHEESDKATFKDVLLKNIVQNEDVQFHWVLLSQDIDDPQNGEALLVEIVKLWVTIRGFSLAASWMEEYKRNMRKTTEKSTGLRKSISGK